MPSIGRESDVDQRQIDRFLAAVPSPPPRRTQPVTTKLILQYVANIARHERVVLDDEQIDAPPPVIGERLRQPRVPLPSPIRCARQRTPQKNAKVEERFRGIGARAALFIATLHRFNPTAGAP